MVFCPILYCVVMKMKKIVIGGCRDYNDYDVFKEFVDSCLSRLKEEHSLTIVSGHCSGVDLMGERYAKENGLGLEIFPADWDKYGRAAGPIRNKQMVEVSDYVIAFWNQKSRGTKSLIAYARELNKPIRVKDISK